MKKRFYSCCCNTSFLLATVFAAALLVAGTVNADQPVVDANLGQGIKIKPMNTNIAELPELAELAEQVEFVNQLLRFAQPVTVLIAVEDGPLFEPGLMEIWIPGEFSNTISTVFERKDAPIADVYVHTLFHEIGHVLFAQYDLPLLAREEDAADALANVLLLEYVENGAEVVLNAAEMFGLEGKRVELFEEEDFWSEHSLDIQRYYVTLCHVYGSDPEAHADLINAEQGLSAERAENCESEYQRIRKGWLGVLAPYLKR